MAKNKIWIAVGFVAGIIAVWVSWRSMAPETPPQMEAGVNARTEDEPERFPPGVVPSHPGNLPQ